MKLVGTSGEVCKDHIRTILASMLSIKHEDKHENHGRRAHRPGGNINIGLSRPLHYVVRVPAVRVCDYVVNYPVTHWCGLVIMNSKSANGWHRFRNQIETNKWSIRSR